MNPTPISSGIKAEAEAEAEIGVKPFEIHRLKGLVLVNNPRDDHGTSGSDHRSTRTLKMIQGVREVFEITDLKPRRKPKSESGQRTQEEEKEAETKVEDVKDKDEIDEGKLVLIGRYIAGLDWEGSLVAWLASGLGGQGVKK